MTTRPPIPFASWTAPAKRSGDGAFARTRNPQAFENHRPHESSVALPAAAHDAPRNSDAPPRLVLFPSRSKFPQPKLSQSDNGHKPATKWPVSRQTKSCVLTGRRISAVTIPIPPHLPITTIGTKPWPCLVRARQTQSPRETASPFPAPYTYLATQMYDRFGNPKGIESSSPGLASPRAYPGSVSKPKHQPQRGCGLSPFRPLNCS
jgi:hypothetical protein